MTEPVVEHAPAGRVSADRRELGVVAVLILIGGGGIVLSSGRPWRSVQISRLPPFGRLAATITGRNQFPALNGLAIVAILVAVLAVVSGVWARRVLGALLLIVAVSAGWYAVRGLHGLSDGRLRSLLGTKLSQSSGVTDVRFHPVWPVVTLLFALVLIPPALALIARAGRWQQGLSSKYAAPVEAAKSTDPWRSLDRGEDPTISDR